MAVGENALVNFSISFRIDCIASFGMYRTPRYENFSILIDQMLIFSVSASYAYDMLFLYFSLHNVILLILNTLYYIFILRLTVAVGENAPVNFSISFRIDI